MTQEPLLQTVMAVTDCATQFGRTAFQAVFLNAQTSSTSTLGVDLNQYRHAPTHLR